MRQKLIRNLFMAAVLTLGTASLGHAEGNQRHGPNQQNGQNENGQGENEQNGTRPTAVPEIDPTAAVAALAMLTCGVFIIRARRH